jgi:hypothetical protein
MTRTPEIEEEDPIRAGREGACYLALEVLRETYPEGEPYKLTSPPDYGFDHVLLFRNERFLDVGGFVTIDELKAWYHDDSLRPERTTFDKVQQRFAGNFLPDEERRYRKLFRHFIQNHRYDLFPK